MAHISAATKAKWVHYWLTEIKIDQVECAFHNVKQHFIHN